MSTRSVIARKTASGFTGIYHHWDGYPAGLGSTLFRIHRGVFNGNTNRMLEYLIDNHPCGWSTINSADWTLPAGPKPDHNLQICVRCGKPTWKHYSQYFKDTFQPWIDAGRPDCPPTITEGSALLMDHSPDDGDPPHGPVCFTDHPAECDETNAQESGCEFAYAFDGDTMHVYSSYCENGIKMIGAFGCGDPNARWKEIAVIYLNGPEPDWQAM